VGQQQHKAALLQRGLGWLRNATLLKAFLSWSEAALEQQAARQSLGKVRAACPATCPGYAGLLPAQLAAPLLAPLPPRTNSCPQLPSCALHLPAAWLPLGKQTGS
jgi:hypothetical protein